jgi:PTS system glucitol/sorbitol-specific IIA component
MKVIYESKVHELGSMVSDFLGENMMIIFNDNAPSELRDYCVLHSGSDLTDTVEAGDVFSISGEEYEIVFAGCEVQKNLRDLGHITIRFNANEEGESLEGSLYVEKKAPVMPKVGDTIKVIKK